MTEDLSRRRLLTTAGAAGAAGITAGALGHAAVSGGEEGQGGGGSDGAGGAGEPAVDPGPPTLTRAGRATVPFEGQRQPGITDPAQAHGHLAAFDLVPGAGRRQAAALMRRWSDTARTLMAGRTPSGDHSGLALSSGPSSLTLTFGFGRSFFDATGLVAARPEALQPLPPFSQDALDPARSDGDLWVQIGANDAMVVYHALRALQREAADVASLRWQMTGFNRNPDGTEQPMTARNLMGQVDGTNNPRLSDPFFQGRIIAASPDWLAGGSFAVVRRIRMLLDDWEGQSLQAQERVIGRRKADGAPLTGGGETTPVDLDATGPDGELVIAANAHVRITAPTQNSGATMLRRSFSYHDGFRDDGAPDAGLLFVCYQSDPRTGFVPVQLRLDRGDALSQFIRHEASGLFALPPGAGEGEYVGQALLEG